MDRGSACPTISLLSGKRRIKTCWYPMRSFSQRTCEVGINIVTLLGTGQVSPREVFKLPESQNSWLSDQFLIQSLRGDIQNTLPARLSVPSGLGVYLRARIMSELSAAHILHKMTLKKDGLNQRIALPLRLRLGEQILEDHLSQKQTSKQQDNLTPATCAVFILHFSLILFLLWWY